MGTWCQGFSPERPTGNASSYYFVPDNMRARITTALSALGRREWPYGDAK